MRFNFKYFFNLIIVILIFSNLPISYAENKNNPVNNVKATEWELVDFDHSLNDSYDDNKREEKLQKINIKFIDEVLFIDNTLIKIKKVTEPDIDNKIFDSVRKILNQTTLNDAIYYNVDLPNNCYQITNPIIFLPKKNYLFLHTNDEFVLSFKPQLILQDEFSSIFLHLLVAKPPVASDFFDRNEKSFTPISEKFKFYLGGKQDDDMLAILKLENDNKNYKLILLASYDMSGSPSLALISLSNQFKIIDKIVLSEQYEKEDGHLDIDSFIDENYLIKKQKIEYTDTIPPKILNVTNYSIDNNGFFIKTKIN